MIVRCPGCGKEFPVSGLGRKTKAVTFNNVCKALQTDSSGHPRFSETARKIGEIFGIFVSPAFVYMRLKREAECRGLTMVELAKEVRSDRQG